VEVVQAKIQRRDHGAGDDHLAAVDVVQARLVHHTGVPVCSVWGKADQVHLLFAKRGEAAKVPPVARLEEAI
jgi:hypothetical protein